MRNSENKQRIGIEMCSIDEIVCIILVHFETLCYVSKFDMKSIDNKQTKTITGNDKDNISMGLLVITQFYVF